MFSSGLRNNECPHPAQWSTLLEKSGLYRTSLRTSSKRGRDRHGTQMEVGAFLQQGIDVGYTLNAHLTDVHWVVSTVPCSSCWFPAPRLAWEAECLPRGMPSWAPSGMGGEGGMLASPSAQPQPGRGGRGCSQHRAPGQADPLLPHSWVMPSHVSLWTGKALPAGPP